MPLSSRVARLWCQFMWQSRDSACLRVSGYAQSLPTSWSGPAGLQTWGWTEITQSQGDKQAGDQTLCSQKTLRLDPAQPAASPQQCSWAAHVQPPSCGSPARLWSTALCWDKAGAILWLFVFFLQAVSSGTANCWELPIRDCWVKTVALIKPQKTALFLTTTCGICVIL